MTMRYARADLDLIGIFRPLTILAILLLENFHKVLRRIIFAYPFWSAGTLAGSLAESTTSASLWVIIRAVAVPWDYVTGIDVYIQKK
jgi:hypothetical protein